MPGYSIRREGQLDPATIAHIVEHNLYILTGVIKFPTARFTAIALCGGKAPSSRQTAYMPARHLLQLLHDR